MIAQSIRTPVGRLVGTIALATAFLVPPAEAAGPLIVISITGGSAQTICDTDCVTCTVGSGECVSVTEADLIVCNPISTGGAGEVTGCDWSVLFDGDDTAVNDNDEINQQMRGLEVAPNGNLVFVVNANDVVPGIGTLNNNDMAVLGPTDILQPYVGGGPYKTSSGPLKVYLDGVMSQSDAAAKPWDALELLPDGTCENNITVSGADNHTCPVIGSLTSGNTNVAKFNGHKFKNEDLIRCVPTAFAGNGAVTGCDYAVMLDADALNGGGASGISTDIEAIDFVSFDASTMAGEMVFQKKSGNPTGFPAHEAGRDLLLYDGSFGSGTCVPSGNPCAAATDCPIAETCNTGSCTIGATPCSTDEDCSGGGNSCTHTRPYIATVTLFFDGSAVGLAGDGQKIEAFSIVPDLDGDGIPDGIDNCPNVDNPPSVCSGGVATCPSGLSSECPMGEVCVQLDSDGDGVGDPCDQCNGRDDAVCFCGDFILDTPAEECDLGDPGSSGFNGEPGSPCTIDCEILGSCTTSGTPCTDVSECPIGEGCCGDTVVDGPAEECDDGNVIEDDLCDNSCQSVPDGVPIVGCLDNSNQPLAGPNVIPAFVKKTILKDTKKTGGFVGFDRWKTKGDFNFSDGLVIDPPTQDVTIVYNNIPSFPLALFSSTLGPGHFAVLGTPTPTRKKWKFLDKEADVVGSPSWRKGILRQKDNKIKFSLDGRNVTIFDLAASGVPVEKVRQTVRIDDVCITALLTCTVNVNGRTVKCESTP